MSDKVYYLVWGFVIIIIKLLLLNDSGIFLRKSRPDSRQKWQIGRGRGRDWNVNPGAGIPVGYWHGYNADTAVVNHDFMKCE